MDLVEKKQLVWVFAAAVVTSLGLSVGSAVLAERADAQGCPLQAVAASGGKCLT
jgi:hypothetical protein